MRTLLTKNLQDSAKAILCSRYTALNAFKRKELRDKNKTFNMGIQRKKKLRKASEKERSYQVVRVVKNLPANAGELRDVGSIPGLGRSPGEGQGNPLQYSCLENPMDRGAW